MLKWVALGLAGFSLCGCTIIDDVSTGSADQIVGSGKLSSISRKVGAFKAVDLDGAMNIEVKIGPQSEIKIEGDDNILPHVRTVIKDGALHVDTDAGYSTHNPLKVSFTIPEIDAAAIVGSGNLAVAGCDSKSLSLDIQGSGNLRASGVAHDLEAAISGSGNLQLSDLKAGDAHVEVAGSGNAKVNVSGVLTGSISGSGDIRYTGKPTQVSKSISGSGDIGPAQ